MEKKRLRQLAKEWVTNLDQSDRKALDQQISKQINLLIQYYMTDKLIIGAYKPMIDEVNWDVCFKPSDDILVSYPEMTPAKSLKYMVNSHEVTPDILLIPGLGFSKEGYRLGRGGGYFDRFLPGYKGKTFGVSYEKRIGQVPTESHDVAVMGLVTEVGWRIYKSEDR